MSKNKTTNFFDKISENLIKNSRNKKRGGGVVLTTPSSKDRNKTKKKDEEEDNDKVLLIVLILFILLFFFLLFFSFFFHVSRPRITGGSDEWSRKRLIKVEKDSRSRHKISHYVYCVSDVKRMNKCTWEKTKTKNTVISKTGHYYVAFKGVDKRGKTSRRSNIEEVYIDNNNPVIEKVKLSATKSTITVKVDAKDKESGVDKYYFSLDGKNYKEGTTKYTFKKLNINRDYNLYVKVVDKVGNETIYQTKTNIKTIIENADNDKNNGTTDKDNADKNNPDKDNYEDDDEANGNENNNGTDNENNGDGNNNGGDNGNGDNNGENKPEKEWDIPIINLDKVPVAFPIGSDYKLPSYYSFGNDTGVVSCVVKGVEYKNTSELGFGNHLITCRATSSHNKSVQVQKLVKVKPEESEEELWDGWIKLNLYYPDNSTNWQWRLGREDEIRDGYEDNGWQDYTGPIIVKLTDVENVYIRYDLNGETVIIPPTGKIVVDIEPESYSLEGNATTNVKITYDKNATVKEYKVGSGKWTEYDEPFTVPKNTLIEARASKKEDVYNNKGDKLYSITVTGTDSVFIGELNPSGGTGGGGTAPGGSDDDFTYKPIERPGGGGGTVTVPDPDTKPSTCLDGPDISVSPDTVVEEVNVSISTKEEARDIYYSVDYGKYQKYTGSFPVKTNSVIRSYYIRKRDGKVSKTSYRYINNIKVPNLPYVRLDAEPNYLSQSVNEVRVTISGSEYDTLEYSYDGITYIPYTEPIKVTNSRRVYARGTNQYGKTVEKLDITTKNPPPKKEELMVKVNATPEVTDELIAKTTITIDYDPKAENKYYRIDGGKVQEYTGPFEMTKNATITAYATSSNGYGETYKVIDFLTEDIASPKIKVSPSRDNPATQVEVTIEYDKKASTKHYKVGDGNYYEYNGPFYIDMNTTIYAYNKNSIGQEKTSSLKIENIVSEPPYMVIDKGMYFLIKLNYPTQAKDKEYKWKVDGTWKPYPSDGILLIKPEYKDKILSDTGVKIKIENENGQLIDFNGNYYLIDVPLQELMENLFMRWNTVKPKAPTIIVNPTEYTKSVLAVIMYQDVLTKKLYKTVKEDGTDSGWLEYDGGIEITDNNTVIYAKGYTRNEVESEIASFKVENIDLEKPTVTAIGDLTTKKQKVSFQVVADDNSKVITRVSWTKGKKDLAYFNGNGNDIPNRRQVTVEENGYYTLYAEDQAGNKVIKVIEIINIDKDAPNIIINVLTKDYSAKAKVEIDYGDSKTREYRIGKDSTTYKAYTGILEINSLNVYNLANEDGSLSIFARGTDEAGNSTEVEEKIYILDLDVPQAPVITAGAGYPVLTEYGVKLGADSYISFDKRDDIDNYYSIDKGKTWKKYTGPFEITSGEIWAKSVKKNSGLEVISKKAVNMPGDALGPAAYDGNMSTYTEIPTEYTTKKMKVSEEMQGRKIYVTGYFDVFSVYYKTIAFYSSTGAQISQIVFKDTTTWNKREVTIPTGTVQINFVTGKYTDPYRINEIEPMETPVISNQKYYPTLTEYGTKQGYSEVTLKYFQTSVERLYSIDGGKTWDDYQDKKIILPLGTVIQAKGINKYGKESYVATYTSVLPSDALGLAAYDGDASTYIEIPTEYTTKKMKVSEEMQGKKIYITGYFVVSSVYYKSIAFYSSTGAQISQIVFKNTTNWQKYEITIPNGTAQINFVSSRGTLTYRVNEVEPMETPVISSTKIYPTISEYGIRQGYSEVTLKYFQTSVERLYSIDGGKTWDNYRDKKIILPLGTVLQAKGINKYGKESYVAAYKSVLPSDALGLAAYDGNRNTYADIPTEYTTRKMRVSEEMQGRKIYVTGYFDVFSVYYKTIAFYSSTGAQISQIVFKDTTTWNKREVTIPTGTVQINFVTGKYTDPYRINEIELVETPMITSVKIYPMLSKNNFSSSRIEGKISYLALLKEKLYSLNNGTTWNEYNGNFVVNAGDKILAKAVNKDDKETSIATYTVPAIADALDPKSFDGSLETVGTILANKSQIFTLGEDTVGQRLRVFTSNAVGTSYLTIYDKAGTQVDKINLTDQITTLEIKDNYYKVVVTAGASALNISEINLRPEQTTIKNNPLIEVSDVIWNTSKGITITYPDWGYTNEYSLDNGVTWNEYVDSFTIDENTTIMARSISDDKLIGSSSFVVTKIDTVEPTIELNIPDTIVVETDYKLPTNHTVGPSGGNPICKVGDTEYTSTKDLVIGTHTIDCSITNGAGIKKIVSASVEVIEKIENSYNYTGEEQVFTVPVTGKYKLETWGAQGGTYNATYRGGYGAYSTGEILLNQGSNVYINIGGQGIGNVIGLLNGGYNGGGDGNAHNCNTDNRYGTSGGGATHIATSTGILSSLETKKESLLIVSGGGGGSFYFREVYGSGADGGGYIGNTATWTNGSTHTYYLQPTGGTQTSGGLGGNSYLDYRLDSGTFGKGSGGGGFVCNERSGGGGGYYGGGGGVFTPGAGGSGYIGNSSLTNKAMYCYNCEESSAEATKTISTTNVSEQPIANYAKMGNGYAKITYLGP